MSGSVQTGGRRRSDPTDASELRELRIESVAHGGDGVAREASGRVVFVPRSAPGDRVRVRLTRERESWARGRLVDVVEPGPGRRPPPCPYYERCGGCQLQHLDAPTELAAKRRAVRDTLSRIGGRDVEVAPVRTTGPRLGYRNRVTLTLRRSAAGVRAGYHRHDDPASLLDVEHCPLAEAPVNRAWRALRASWGEAAEHLPGGGELRITVRATLEGDVGLLVEGGAPDDPGSPGVVADAVDDLEAFHWIPSGGAFRRLAGSHRLRERWNDWRIGVGPRTFLQVNRYVGAALESRVDDLLGPGVEGRWILDLYAGMALRAIRWAERGARTVAVEREPWAVEDGRRLAARRGVSVDSREGDVETHIADLLPADAAVVNPPRAGLSESVARELAHGDLDRLVYVSCDPATLARDLGRLGPGWRVRSVEPFDAFPQTAHVETVACLERRPSAPGGGDPEPA